MDTSTDPSRDEIVEVTEFMQVKPHPWPLERARARYAARTGNTGQEKRHIEARLRNDHHPSDLSQGSQVVQAQEGRSLHRLGAYRDEPPDQPRSLECLPHVPGVKRWKWPGGQCFVCDEVPADDDWYQHDWEDIAICKPCKDNTEKGRRFLQYCISKFGASQN